MGDYELALPVLEEALKAQRWTLGEDAADTLCTISNITMLHLRPGNFSLSLSLAEKALAVHQRMLGKEHADTLPSIDNLSILRWHMAHGEYVSFHAAEAYEGTCELKDLECAKELLAKVVKSRFKVLGKPSNTGVGAGSWLCGTTCR